jgi:TonB family protein
MFDYATSHYRKRPTNKRLLGSWVVSCLAHTAFLLLLIEYPQLLTHGAYRWFHPVNVPDTEITDGRFVAFTRSNMEWPSPEALKQLLPDYSKAAEQPLPPVHVNLPPITVSSVPVPLPKPPNEPDVSADLLAGRPTIVPPVGTPPDTGGAGNPTKPKTEDPTLPGQLVEPKTIPKGITDPAGGAAGSQTTAQSGGDAAKIPAQKTGAVRPEQLGATGPVTFDDTKGFPLDEFALLIRDLVNGNWFIPSNLRDSQGSTTVVFYIYKDGHIDGLRRESTSGLQSLDNAALAAVWNSAPFPPLPAGFPADRVGARIVFAYNERR